MKTKHKLTGKVIFLVLVVFLSISRIAFCQEKKMSPSEGWLKVSKKGFSACINFLKNPDLYNRSIKYIQKERAALSRSQQKGAVLIFADLFLSLLSLILSLWLIAGVKTFVYKKYLWLFLFFNFGWFALLAVFRGIWEALFFMVLRLEPGLFGGILDNFTLVIIAASFFMYLWLLARTFSLRFFGSLKVLIVSHLFYLIAVFVLSMSLSFKGADWQQSFREKLGPTDMSRGYLWDMGKISTRRNALSLFRFRALHL